MHYTKKFMIAIMPWDLPESRALIFSNAWPQPLVSSLWSSLGRAKGACEKFNFVP